MNIGEQLDRDWHHVEHTAADALRHLMHPHAQDAPQPAAAPTIATDTPEVTPMSLLAELRTGLADIAGKVESLAGNPLFAQLEQIGLTELHLTPAEIQAVTAIIGSLEASHAATPQPADVAAVPQAVPAGPVIAGQA